MIEKEIKVLTIDPEEIEQRMINKGFEIVKDERQRNIIFKGHDNIKLRHTLSFLDYTDTYELIRKTDVKGSSKSNYKVKKEMSEPLTEQEFYRMQEILKFIGYEVVLDGIKMRKSYEKDGYLYEIDEWDRDIFPVPYLEVEVMGTHKKLSDGLEKLWTKDEIKELVMTKEGITDLQEFYNKAKNKMYKVIIEQASDKKKRKKKDKKK